MTRISVTQGVMDITVDLTAMDCANCGVVFALPTKLDKQRRDDGGSIYCPSGHSMSYAGELSKLRAALRRAEQDRDWYKSSEADQRGWRQKAERRLAAQKGEVTKLRKRLVAGTCPFGCHRHFVDLERHVATMHPGLELAAETIAETIE